MTILDQLDPNMEIRSNVVVNYHSLKRFNKRAVRSEFLKLSKCNIFNAHKRFKFYERIYTDKGIKIYATILAGNVIILFRICKNRVKVYSLIDILKLLSSDLNKSCRLIDDVYEIMGKKIRAFFSVFKSELEVTLNWKVEDISSNLMGRKILIHKLYKFNRLGNIRVLQLIEPDWKNSQIET